MPLFGPMIMHNLLISSILCLLTFTSCSLGKGYKWEEKYPFIRKASSFSSSEGGRKAYDYIVIGGGAAGCPLAATLSKNFSVLLLERGGVPFGNPNVSFMKNFHISLADTSATSASQVFVSTDGVFNSRARVLGGGTAINAGFYTRASSSYINGVGWDANLVNESYPWIEKQIVHQPQLAPWQRAVRDGLLEIGVSPFNGFTYDHLYGTKVGGTIFDRFGRRHTAAELLTSGNPQKLNVLVYASVQRIVFDTKGRRPRAIGVIFKDEKGNQHKAFISKRKKSEIILAAGSIASPQLLLISGIGPKSDLKKLNITLVHENKHVGKGVCDNPLNTIFVPMDEHVTQSLIQTVGITKMGVYIEASSGFGQSSDSIRRNHGLVSAEIGQLSTIPPKLRKVEAIQAYINHKRDLPHEVFKGGFILEKIANPLSEGEIALINTDIDENPSVTFNYFSHPHDLEKCVEGIRVVEKLITSKNFTDFAQCSNQTMEKILNMSVYANVNLIPKHTNDTKSLEQFCKDTVVTIWHYHGGCHVGKVVNHDYKVLGVSGVRVVGGAVLAESPGTNPQATVLMMGRYMGVKILRERLGKAADI